MKPRLLSPRVIGFAIVAVILLASLAAPELTGQNPEVSGEELLGGVSALHWFGTDDLGRDVFTRVLYGGRVSLVLGLGAAALASMIGIPVGMVAGFARGWVGVALVQIIDLFVALPGLVLALVVTAMVGATMLNLVVVLGLVQWPTIARLVRGQVLALRETLFIDAARAVGTSGVRILTRHIWPNIARVVAAQFAVAISTAIFTSASLSFLGLGLPPPMPDWGGMVQSGFDYLSVNPWLSLGPGAAVTLTIFGFYLIGRSID